MGLATAMLVAALAGATAGTASAVPTGDLSVSVAQDGDGGAATVTVTANGSSVEGANVSVVALNNSSYAGTGTYVTDENGTVGLTAPAENVTVEVTAEAGNATETVQATLTAPAETDEPFGDEMAAYVHKMISVRDRASPGGEVSGDSLGQLVSQYATEHNPGAEKRPDHAGPPEDRGRDGGDAERGQGHDRSQGNDRGGQGQGQGHADGVRGNGTGGGPPW